jgi:hypothetical protein
MTLSIHIALISQGLQVRHKYFISYFHLGYLGRREGGQCLLYFFLVVALLLRPLFLRRRGLVEANPRTFCPYKSAHNFVSLLVPTVRNERGAEWIDRETAQNAITEFIVVK